VIGSELRYLSQRARQRVSALNTELRGRRVDEDQQSAMPAVLPSIAAVQLSSGFLRENLDASWTSVRKVSSGANLRPIRGPLNPGTFEREE
jgi:hypothetical protein